MKKILLLKLISLLVIVFLTMTMMSTGVSAAVTAYATYEAENFNAQSGIQTGTCNEGGSCVGWVNNGDYIKFDQLDFGNGGSAFEARISSATLGGNIEVRVDSLTGNVIATLLIAGTGGWENWKTAETAISSITGIHDVYLKFTGGSDYLFNINWFKFRNKAKFEPDDGKCIIAVGQARNEMDDYKALSDIPDQGGYMIYTATVDAAGMTSASDKGAGINDFNNWATTKPNTICQLGIDMTDYDGHQAGQDEEAKVALGQRDDNIRTIANAVKNSGKPVYVRIGYEADSTWNHYEAWSYIKAYRRVHDIFREQGVNNAAFVWSLIGYPNSAAPAPYNSSVAVDTWYPGDDYVDWVSLSWFGWSTSTDETNAANCRNEVVLFANKHRKPLMIAEATPRAYYPMTSSSTWDNYFQKIFDFITANNVKMFCYINQNWSLQPIFSDPQWGDSRIQQSGASYIYNNWETEVTKTKYLNESTSLYSSIDFNSSESAKVKVVRPRYDLPGKFEAEKWEDSEVVSQGTSSDTESTSNRDKILCWLTNASWTKYNVNATSSKQYTVKLRIANGSGTNTSATIRVDNVDVMTVTIPTTSNWDTYTTVTSSSFNIDAGSHSITVKCNGSFNLNWVQFD